jgi:hypothetical protein
MQIISGFQHSAGIHCGSTAMRDLVHFAGLPLSEPMCFGLGSGLGFSYLRDPNANSPSHLFYGRTGNLERDLCVHLAFDFEEGTDDDAAHAWQVAKNWIDQNVPVMLHVELSRIPYYNTRTRFPGHRVVLVGYDDARRVALLADNGFNDLQEITYDELAKARAMQALPIHLHNNWLVIRSVQNHTPLGEAILRALRHNAVEMTIDLAPHRGIWGMQTLADDFETWGDSPDWEFCARFGYQNIEVRGNGGGAFRRLYAQFLREAEAFQPILRAEKFAERLTDIANEWSQLGAVLKQIYEEKNRAGFAQASNVMRHLAIREENFWGAIFDVIERA